MKMNWKKVSIVSGGIFSCIVGMFASNNEKGIEYYRAELYDAAKIYFNLQIPKNQGADLAESYYFMGECYGAEEKLDSAAYFYQKAIEADPEYPYSYIGEGKLSLKNKNISSANDLFKKAIGFAKKNPAIHTAVAEAYIDVKQYDKAEEVLDKARSVKKNFSGIYVAEGDMLMAQGKTGDACAKYENAILFDPNDKVAYLKEARVYKTINADLALDILNRLIAVDAEYIPAYAELGETYYKKYHYNKAIEAYNKFIEIPGVPVKHLVNYASLLYFTKDYVKSLTEINKVLNVEQQNLVMRRLQIYNNYELERYHVGLEFAERFMQSVSKDDLIAQDYMYYGRLLDKNKNSELAIKSYEKALGIDENKTEIYKDLAVAYERIENYPEAINSYQKFIEMDKNAGIMDLYSFGVICYSAANQKIAAGDSLVKTPEMIANDSIQSRQYFLKSDSIFAEIIERSPDTYLGYFWRGRCNVGLDPDAKEGLAKPFYEEALTRLEATNEGGKRNKEIIECYRYLGYYFYMKEEVVSARNNFEKILRIDPQNEVAIQFMDATKNTKTK